MLAANLDAEPTLSGRAAARGLRPFLARLAETPDATAIRDGGGALTYAGLDRRARALAAALRARGLHPEERVGVALDRSPDLVAAMLAVLRAGGAFVPLDPAYPAGRLAYMAADAGVRIALTTAELAGQVRAAGAEPLCVEDVEDAWDGDDGACGCPGADALAYVIYTSGSTGRPKGVGVTQRGLENAARAMGEAFFVGAGDRVLQFASPSFDASVCEIFVALGAGAELNLAPREALIPGPGLAGLLASREITHLVVPPSALALLPQAELPALGTVVVAGEACGAELVARWSPGRRFVNAYGPTEAAVCATAAVCEPNGATPPIGTAIRGASVHVLDAALDPAADGELCIGGEGVARGYLGRPGLTAERFVPDPFAALPGARMYRSGDRVRARGGGALEFVGRIDEQVKVRGHRIEPGEVAAALAAHPSIAHAVVVARDDAPGGRGLVAYFVAREGADAPAADALRETVARALPEHMVPAAFVALGAFPLTPNGKVDRRALPAPAAHRPLLSAAYVAPRTEAERAVAAAWSEVLGVDGIGAEDAFFELGGHSLAATQVVSRLRAATGAEVPLAAVLGGGTVAGMARALEAARARIAAPDFPPILPVARGGDLPPSFSQERVWFLTQLNPDNRSYHAHAALVFRGALDVPALEDALSGVIARHEVFRSTFPTVDGRPAQRIHAPWRVHLPRVDVSHLPAEARETAVRQWLAEDFTRRFDLAQLPLVRWALLRVADDEHRLVHVEHHIIHDGWGFNVFLRELLELYRARLAGRDAALPPLEVQFADFCAWQREWMRGDAARAQLDFWRRTLAGSPPVLELPTDRPRPAVQRYRGAAPRFRLSGETFRRVRETAHAQGATPYMAMLAAFEVLLHRWSGQDDISVGTGIAVRRQREVEGMMGMFVNSLVFRTDLSGEPTFRELLARVRRTTLDAYANQDVPFEAVVDAVQPERNLSHNPLFQVMFSFHDSALPELEIPGAELELDVALSNRSAKFDLNIVAIPHAEQRGARGGGGDDGVTLVWEHDSDLFDLATMERMFGHYARLLEAAAAAPDTPISRLPMLAEDERGALLAAGRATASFPAARRIHELFEARAAERPDAPALTCDGVTLGYAELNARANRLAHRLIARGVGPEVRVAVCLERSPELVTAILAVLKAGGAYVPLDPAYPAERIAFVLEDAAAPVVVTHSRLAGSLPSTGAALVRVDDAAADAESSPENPRVDAAADSLAYVIYTSGSTGRPKGVLVTHANVVRLFAATDAWFGFGADDVWTLFHSCAFDFSVWEIWGALLYGGRLVVVPFLVSRSPGDFHRLLADEGVTVLSQTPSAFRQLVAADAASGVGPDALALKWVIFGGEALDPQGLRPWLERHGDERPRLVNMYGITETTVHVTWQRIARADLERGGSPIGVPLPDLSLYLLDRALQPVPAGVAGELFVGGAGVARGYLNRPELTAERFVRDPFSGDGGARLYRSGDLARRRADGEVEYLGRADEQVKLRGFRIEPGEIEAALKSHAALADAVVVVREDAPGEQRLVAYVVPAEGAEAPGAAELRALASASLPEHMVPAAFAALDALPLTANGKLDRRALPAPAGEVATGEAYVAPRNAVEAALAEAWSEVLGVERPGIDDNYFALGGDSIRTVRVVARARERGVVVTLPQVFLLQTIRKLAEAAALAPETDARAESTLEPFAMVADEVRRRLPGGVEDAYPLTALQLGMLYHSELDPGSVRYHNVNSYRLETRWDEAALRGAVRRLSRRHAILRTSFDLATDPEPLQLVHAGAEVPLAIDDLRHLRADEQEAALDAWMRAEMDRRFDWTAAPLVRFHAHRLADGVFRFSVTEHHAVLDGWSMASLLTELFRHFAALRDGTADPTGEAPRLAFRDFVALERAALESPGTRGYWARALDGAEPTRLPRSAAAVRETEQRGAAGHAVELSADASEALKRVAEREGVPLKSVLLAAHLRVLALLGGRREVLTGLVTNGRPEAADGERILGLFLNTVPLRAAVAPGSWAELARAAFEAEREMLPHRRFPLAEAQRLAGRAPLVDVAFNYIHFHVYHDLLAAGGVSFEGAKFFQETEFSLVANFYTDAHTGRVRFRLDYDPAAMGADEAAALAGRYERALAAIAADADARHDAAPLLTEEERDALLALGDGGPAEAGAPTLAALFAAQARRTPHAPALAAGDERLTYAELARRADAIARALRATGVRAEEPVGVCVGRGAELVAAMLGTLRSGGVYLPLDPAYPAERLAYLLADSGAGVVVTTAALAERIPAGPRVVLLEDAAMADGGEGDALHPSPEDAAYLIYTSGSTGTPKGVVVRHGEAAAHCAAAVEAFGLTEADRVLHFASASFDVSLEQALAPLAAGACVVLRGDDVPAPAELAALVRRERLTVVNPPTAYWQQLVLDEVSRAALKSVRLVVSGGDVMHPGALRAWDAEPGPARLLNAYGPTEAIVTAAAFEVPAGFGGARVPVGRPLAGRRLYVVGEGGELLPAGVPGELWIGGPLLARGYLGRAEVTAERFVRDPFPGDPEARAYRTGDRARWRDDGLLEFLGRADFQVKVRGFRIELGEVEAALRAHPHVREAVAAVREDEPGRKLLAGYVVAAVGTPVDAAALRAFLADRLPDHAIPGAFALLDRLPLTPNGKVDRAALPAPAAESAADAGYEAPRTPIEELLAELWAGVLRIGRAGRRDDFFALGGDSLLATRLVARVREAFRVELPLRALFDAPTVAELAPRIAAALRDGDDAGVPAPSRAGRPAPLPLSFAQQRLWFLDRMEPGRPVYNLPTVVRLTGALDAAALEAALDALVHRHDALRTVIRAVDGEPAQVVLAAAGFRLPVVELADVPAAEREAEALRRVEADVARPFDLADGPLFRALLVRIAPRAHLLALTLHHAVGDGGSLHVLLRELSALYAAARAGDVPALPAPALQYGDFAAWQRTWLTGERMAREVAWWRERLAGAPPALELPADRARPARQSYAGALHRFAIGAETADALRALGRACGATPFMTLLAGFQALLARWSGSDEVVVGTPVEGRTHAGLEPVVGFFANTLAVRADLSGGPSFRALLGRVREAVLGAIAHQEVPFEKLVEELNPERSLGRQPVFQAVFAMNRARAADSLALDGICAEPLLVENGTSKFDLTLYLTERPDGLAGVIEYATDLFDATTMARLAEHFRALLAAAAAEPDAPVAALPLASSDEAGALRAWGQAPASDPGDIPIHRLFEAAAAATPEALALEFGAARLTYAELDAAANRLARRLRAAGVGPESRVGVAMERSAELVVAILAALKAGGAYVPLDASYPAGRLAFMLEDTGIGALVVADEVPAALAGFGGAVVSLARDAAAIAAEDARPPADVEVHPESLAYVVYTSGSTGRPKGIGIPHRAVVRLVRGTNYVQVRPDDRFAQLSNASFDALTFELWGALLNGAALVGIERGTALSPAALAKAIGERGITAGFLTAALFNQVAAEAPGAFAGMRTLLAGGEALDPATCRRVLEAGAPARLLNGYGPTETTTFAVVHPIAHVPERAAGVPIGTPVGGTSAYVLDAALRPCAVGVPGELHLGGTGVARGYLGRPGLTAGRFVPDPFRPGPGARMYRTGDTVRRLADGTIEYLGRADQQVKIRGFRIEPGEVEAALRAHPAVRDAAVIVDGAGDGRRLLAFHVPEGEGAAAELREHLRARLPEYMLPAGIQAIGAIPLTPNGKVDRRALAAAWAGGDAGAEQVPPRGEVEEAVAALWREVLKVERVGAHDGFFALGGHSLLAIRIATRLQETFRVEVPIGLVFEVPTVAEMARALAAREPKPGWVARVAAIANRVRAMAADEVKAGLATEAGR